MDTLIFGFSLGFVVGAGVVAIVNGLIDIKNRER
jgi:hypothetical protein